MRAPPDLSGLERGGNAVVRVVRGVGACAHRAAVLAYTPGWARCARGGPGSQAQGNGSDFI